MNNRIQEYVPLPIEPDAEVDMIDQARIDLDGSLKLAREWAVQHPLACLAAAFVFGGAVAWIVKRR